MKPTLLLCLLLLALAIPSRAEDNARWDIGLVSGVASSDLTLGKSVSSYCSPSYDGASMPERALLLITEIRECDKGYGATETLYGVVTRGKKYYARAAEVREVKEEEIAKLRDLSEEDRVKYEDAILKSSKLFWMEEVQKSFAFLEKTVKQGIAVLTASIYDISEYTEGTGFRITFYNPTKKTIKYVTVTYVGYNAVKDPVRDYRHPKAVLTLKGIGPIAPGESGGYNQDYAWMTDVVEDFKLTGITVQYMDGSKKTVKRPDNVSMSWTAYQTLKTYLAEESEAESAEEEKAQANGLAAPAAEVTK